ncbi:MAG: aminopeptidase, partial [Alicyclobacillus sp.]|nr:aminopeptidase [Alicyclobacillus sp.]
MNSISPSWQPVWSELERYANLAVRIGANLQPNDWLLIRSSIEAAPLVHAIAARAYACGARRVDVDWEDSYVDKLRLLHGPDQELRLLTPGRQAL